MNWGLLPTTVRMRTAAAYALARSGERTRPGRVSRCSCVCTAEIAALTASTDDAVRRRMPR